MIDLPVLPLNDNAAAAEIMFRTCILKVAPEILQASEPIAGRHSLQTGDLILSLAAAATIFGLTAAKGTRMEGMPMIQAVMDMVKQTGEVMLYSQDVAEGKR